MMNDTSTSLHSAEVLYYPNTHTAVLCRVISLQKESILHCTNNPVCACFYKAESEKEKGWDKHMLFRNQLDSLDNDSSCMGNKPSCD